MNKIAYIYDGFVINWSTIIIVLAVVCAMLVAFALAVRKPGYSTALAVALPIAMLLGCVFARIIHWYCRTDQYESFAMAFTDFTVGGFSLIGIVVGCLAAALIVWAIGLAPSLGGLLDIMSPAAAVGIALGRLSFLFNYSDRGKVFIENEANRRLPIGSAVINVSSGATEWRFATFFIQSLVAAAIFVVVLALLFLLYRLVLKNGSSTAGMTFFMFMIIYFSTEILLDSTRYDALFLRSNGFVSLMQIFAAVVVVLSFVYISVNSVRFNGLRFWHFILWVLYLGSLGLAGYMEYYVQRHGNLYMLSYSLMGAGLVISIGCSFVMLGTTLCRRSRLPKAE
ncbi:MAG: prolipoprotein diacylglyceryl transferase [Oscillospiraceae bacterium]|nr:prolipoprotein diacylglyceryl transferase [Oscillospiraceae bacterium]